VTRLALAPVGAGDASALHAMLLALAEGDGVAEVRTTVAALGAALSGPVPLVVAHFIISDGDVAGFTMHSWKWGTFTGVADLYLNALYVRPEHRRHGAARWAMAELARIAVAAGCTRIEWLTVGARTGTAAFYDAIGSTPASHMTPRRLHGQALRALVNEQRGQIA